MTTPSEFPELFAPLQVGAVALPNRMVMSPMTRGRAERDGTPNDLMAEYYAQRSGAGLIVTEATSMSPQGVGWVGAPGIYTDSHVAGWRGVTGAVHAAGGRIFLQLWHMGRVSHPDFQNGELPVGPSAVAAKGQSTTASGKKDYVVPRALPAEEIPGIVADYAAAARRARDARFDGVEIHGANGYLLDQFLRDGSNLRTDDYGGALENRVRFLLEVAQAVREAWSADRVGVRLSPRNPYNDMRDGAPEVTFGLAAQKLGELGLAYLHLVDPLPGSPMYAPGPLLSGDLRQAFGGPVIVNGGYDAATATAAIREGRADAVAFGVPFLANPDLVDRFRSGAPLNPPDFSTLYTPGAKGYIDYPALAAD
jgi:N-ethylmaleimide reductase